MRRSGLVACLTVLGCAAIVAGFFVAALLRLSLYRVQTGSMAPAFPIGTVVVDSGSVAPEPHRAVTFHADGHVVTHVLMGYNADGSLITRGLANPTDDHWRRPVYPRDIRGRVIFTVLLLAPTFWLSARGAAFAVGLVCVILAYTAVRSSASSRTGFSV